MFISIYKELKENVLRTIDVSVIIPVFNSCETIIDCVNSILYQNTKYVYQIVIIDDCSTDKTLEVVNLNFSRIKNIIIIQNNENKGPAYCRNIGIENATGKIVLFTDSDCVVDINWIDNMVLPFEENNQVAGVQGRYLTKQTKILPIFIQTEIEQRYRKMKKHQAIDFVGTYSAGYRLDVLKTVGCFDISYKDASGEDVDLSYRISSAGYKMVFNPEAICYHKHTERLWDYIKQKFYRGFWRVRLYSKHSSKIMEDSYTTINIKLQVILTLLYGISLFYSVFCYSSIIFFSTVLYLLLLFLIDISLISDFVHRKRMKGIISLFYILCRTLALTTGLLVGILHLFGISFHKNIKCYLRL